MFLPLGVIGIGGIEVAANAGATPAHFMAAGAVIVTLVGIVKAIAGGYDWSEHKVKDIVGDALKLHGAEDQRRHDLIKAEVKQLTDALKQRPCIAGKCRNREVGE